MASGAPFAHAASSISSSDVAAIGRRLTLYQTVPSMSDFSISTPPKAARTRQAFRLRRRGERTGGDIGFGFAEFRSPGFMRFQDCTASSASGLPIERGKRRGRSLLAVLGIGQRRQYDARLADHIRAPDGPARSDQRPAVRDCRKPTRVRIDHARRGKLVAEPPTFALGVGPFIAIMTPSGSPSDGSGARLPGR